MLMIHVKLHVSRTHNDLPGAVDTPPRVRVVVLVIHQHTTCQAVSASCTMVHTRESETVTFVDLSPPTILPELSVSFHASEFKHRSNGANLASVRGL